MIHLKKNHPIRLILIFLILCFNSCNNKIEVDLISHNGIIYSLDDNNNVFEATAFKNGKIVDIGKTHQILNKYQSKNKLDLKGKTAYPGFIDAHCHFLYYGLQLAMVDLSSANSFKEIIEILKKNNDKNDGDWLIGYGWDQNQWEDKNWPNNELLNKNFKNINVVLNRIDGHAIMVNETAIKTAKVPIDTVVIGGYIEKINDKVTGLFMDNAMSLILEKIPEENEESKKKALLKAQQDCISLGLTTVDIAGLNKSDIELINNLQLTGELKIKVYAMLSDNEENFRYFIDSIGKPLKTTKLNVRSFKFFADGSLGSRGACLLKPYSDQKTTNGMLLQKQELFEKKLNKIKDFGFQACTHAIGDSTNRTILKSYGKILKTSNDFRWRVEHVQCISPEDIHLLKKYNIIPSVQPTHATSDFSWALLRLGKNRLTNCYRYQTLFEENRIIALGTDFPVEEINPIHTFYAAVFRKNKDGLPLNGFQKNESLNRLNALKGMTIWPALANFEENEKGSLEINKAADMIVLDKDILDENQKKILNTKVLYTIIDGEIVYQN
jgi:predicted amidohydrolase YtcJ